MTARLIIERRRIKEESLPGMIWQACSMSGVGTQWNSAPCRACEFFALQKRGHKDFFTLPYSNKALAENDLRGRVKKCQRRKTADSTTFSLIFLKYVQYIVSFLIPVVFVISRSPVQVRPVAPKSPISCICLQVYTRYAGIFSFFGRFLTSFRCQISVKSARYALGLLHYIVRLDVRISILRHFKRGVPHEILLQHANMKKRLC